MAAPAVYSGCNAQPAAAGACVPDAADSDGRRTRFLEPSRGRGSPLGKKSGHWGVAALWVDREALCGTQLPHARGGQAGGGGRYYTNQSAGYFLQPQLL
jgi:hypothetical protein